MPTSTLVSEARALDLARQIISTAPAGLATDFDGTISLIVSPPEAATALPGAREALEALATRLALIAIVSGRPIVDLVPRIRVRGAVYVGNHGLEAWRDGEAVHLDAPPTLDETLCLAEAGRAIAARLPALAGTRLEDKGTVLAVHFRDAIDRVQTRERVWAMLHGLAGSVLKIREGKLVLELCPQRGASKGNALERFTAERALRGVVYFGDDMTDVDAFQALRGLRHRKGIATLSVAVLGRDTPPAVREGADLCVDGPPAVVRLLRELSERDRSDL